MKSVDSSFQQSKQPHQNDGKVAYRISEAVKATGLSRSLIYKLIAERKLRSVRVGKCRLIPAAALTSLIDNAEER